VLLLTVGFLAAQMVLQTQSMQGVVESVSIPAWILILAVPAVIIGVFGYRWIHRVMQVSSVLVRIDWYGLMLRQRVRPI
jgi:purine-cytosine permease-like protein